MSKNILIRVATLLAVCGATFACTPEQSKLTVDDLGQKATIVGKVTYNRGIKWNSGVIETYSDWQPAANVTLVVRIPYSAIGSSLANGNYEIETKTGSDGKYSVDVPLGVSAISVTVTARPFYQKKSVLDDEGKEAFVQQALYNNSSTQYVTLNPGDIKTVNITVSSSAEYGD